MLSVCQKPCHKFLFLDFRYEALELRDGDMGMYLGKSVQRAVKNINEKISEALIGMDPILQSQIDQAMIDLDKTEKKVSFPSPHPILFNKMLSLDGPYAVPFLHTIWNINPYW